MNELRVKTIELTPATIEFNYDELSNILDESLKKYDGLTFTEEDATECKKTIAELNKGKKALDTYRKETKKELTYTVTNFENQCKELNKKFDAVINPLKEQHQAFEDRRKREKRQQIEEIIARIIEDYDLHQKYAVELVVTDSYLTKSKSIKSIADELRLNAEKLQMQQVKEESDKLSIKSIVEVANSRYDVNLTESAYVRLLDFKDVETIKNQILEDAQNEVEKKLQEEEKNKQAEEQKEPEFIEDDVPFFEPVENTEDEFTDEVFIEDPFVTKPTLSLKQYEIVGTKEQLAELEDYMIMKDIEWKVVE